MFVVFPTFRLAGLVVVMHDAASAADAQWPVLGIAPGAGRVLAETAATPASMEAPAECAPISAAAKANANAKATTRSTGIAHITFVARASAATTEVQSGRAN